MAKLESILPPEFAVDMEVAIHQARQALNCRPEQYSHADLLLTNALYKAYAAGVASQSTDRGRAYHNKIMEWAKQEE